MRYFIAILFVLLSSLPVSAAVDIALRGKDPIRLEDIYQQDGVPYIAVEDALNAVGLSGHWDSIAHVFKIKTSRGWAEISPASGYLKVSGEYYPLKDPPRFIDGRLRVTDSFILNQLAQLVGRPVYFRNLDPDTDTVARKEPSGIEQLFSFLLNKKTPTSGPLIRAVAIDPGHGGLDTGVIAPDGFKEKQLNLEIAEQLAKQLKMKMGIPIYLSRDGDYELSMEQRLESATRDDVDVWVLLHAQASLSDQVSGISLFIRPEPAPVGTDAEQGAEESGSMQLARQMRAALQGAGAEVRGIYPSSRLSLGRGNLPTVLVELGFLSQQDELQKLRSEDYQKQIVQALFSGIKNFASQSKEKQDAVN